MILYFIYLYFSLPRMVHTGTEQIPGMADTKGRTLDTVTQTINTENHNWIGPAQGLVSILTDPRQG